MPFTGKYIPGNSLIHKLDVQSKIIVFIILILTTVFASSLVGYMLLFAILGILITLSKFPLKLIFSSIKPIWKFFIIIFILNVLFFNGETILFQWRFFRLTQEGIQHGITIILNIFIILILNTIFTLTTELTEMMNGLEALLMPLSHLKIPIEQAVLILTISFQFIPTLLQEGDIIRKAQTARGADFESKYLHKKIMAAGALFIPVFIAAFKRADDLSIAMEARGFRDAKHRTKKSYPKISVSGWITIIVFLLLFILQIYIAYL